MPYHIETFEGGQLRTKEQWDDPLTAARDYIKDAVESGRADRGEIKDDDGKLVGHWPRVLSPAPGGGE